MTLLLLAVLDTNVLVSALILPGSLPARLLRRALAREFVLILSESILQELTRVLARPKMVQRYAMTPERAAAFESVLRDVAVLVPGAVRVEAVPGDADDNHVVACAVEGHAEFLVSGDEHLRSLGQYQSVRIVSPAQFAAALDDGVARQQPE